MKNSHSHMRNLKGNKGILLLLVVILTFVGAASLTGCGDGDSAVVFTSDSGDSEPENSSTDDSDSEAARMKVHADWTEEALSDLCDYDEFTMDTGEPSDTAPELSSVVIFTEETISDLKILALTFEDVTEDGQICFQTEELYTQGILRPEHPLVVNAPFYGSIPNIGASYTDENGTTRYFSIGISGKDGSIVQEEFYQ